MSLTGANSVITLALPGIFNVPQQLQGFAADDVFTTEMVRRIEVLMGVDGFLSGGFVNVEVKQTFALQGDSPSNDFFDEWDAQQQALGDVFTADGTELLRSVGKAWSLTRGFLTGYTPVPEVKKLIQPRKHEITWNFVRPAPV